MIYVEPLASEEIRWFYKDGVDKRWVEFCGFDSLRIEKIYQERQKLINENDGETDKLPPIEKIVVRGGMYDVEFNNMKCVSIYWPGKCHALFILSSAHCVHYINIVLLIFIMHHQRIAIINYYLDQLIYLY